MAWQQQPQQQHYMQYQYYAAPNQHYGCYGQYFTNDVFPRQAWQAYGYQHSNELKMIFDVHVNSNPQNIARNAIQAEDLLRVMNESVSIRNFYKINWNRELCSVMLAMLDRSQDGFMQWEEFQELQQCLVAWYSLFSAYDQDKNGFADSRELFGVITNTFNAFRKRDQRDNHHDTGYARFDYDDFIRTVLCL